MKTSELKRIIKETIKEEIELKESFYDRDLYRNFTDIIKNEKNKTFAPRLVSTEILAALKAALKDTINKKDLGDWVDGIQKETGLTIKL